MTRDSHVRWGPGRRVERDVTVTFEGLASSPNVLAAIDVYIQGKSGILRATLLPLATYMPQMLQNSDRQWCFD